MVQIVCESSQFGVRVALSENEDPGVQLPDPKSGERLFHVRLDSAAQKCMTDEDCIAAYCSGIETAFVVLYERYRLDVHRYCMRALNHDSDKAGDAFQEVFIKISEHASQFRRQGSAQAWIMTIARNVCRNMLRGSTRNIRLDEMNHEPVADQRTDPESIIESTHVAEELALAFDRLPEKQREAILLQLYQGYSYQTIAKITGSNLSTIRQRIWRAKQTLRALLYDTTDHKMNQSRGGSS